MIRNHVKFDNFALQEKKMFIIMTIKKPSQKTKMIVNVLKFVSKIMQIKNSKH